MPFPSPHVYSDSFIVLGYIAAGIFGGSHIGCRGGTRRCSQAESELLLLRFTRQWSKTSRIQ